MNAIGRLDDLYPKARKALQDSLDLTANNKSLVLTFCLSYGGRSEIIDAIKRMIEKDRTQHIDLENMNEEFMTDFLYDPSLPAPDLLIRTGAGNRERISNFLLWQIAYTEIYFTKTLWPDFRKNEFINAIEEYQKRERLFGRV
jgi:undecaprenyl diphosphate synthase